MREPAVSTFSVVAKDEAGDEWGVAVASKFLAAGSVVPWANSRAGAIATQAWANISFGPDGLTLLESGMPARETLEQLIAKDEGREHRQVGIVDREGRAATFTGSECLDWAGGVTGDGFSIQGNILTGPEVVESMKDAFLSTSGSLTEKLLATLLAGDRAGGDKRGRQSAAILIVREGGSYGGYTDKALDLRVDDHTDPVPELQRLYSIHQMLFEKAGDDELIDLSSPLVDELGAALHKLGYLPKTGHDDFDEEMATALKNFMGAQNLEERWVEGPRIDRTVLQELRRKAEDG